MTAFGTYGSQQSVHKLVRLLGLHEALTFNDCHGKLWYDSQMFLQCLTYPISIRSRRREVRDDLCNNLAVSVVVVDSLDLAHSSKGLEGSVIELVDVGHVRICDNNIWQGLHISQPVGESSAGQ